jgi:RNA polymerase II elongation factor ELL
MKKTLRERLIHLLAVRPYKKPELLLRMHKDGVKEKDRKNIGLILREVSECKSNVFDLKRTMWNDVIEDWPFYTELDKAALRRRKPQNLTPPGSDTGSTSSGHSPSSTNPASPPQITNPHSLKRHGAYDQPVEQGPTPKKKRVSSYKRPPGSNSWDSKSPGLTGVSPRLGMVVVDRHQSVSPRLDLEYNSVPDDSIPDWGQFHDGEAHRSPTVRHSSPEHHSVSQQSHQKNITGSPSLEETVSQPSPGQESPEQQSHTDSPQMQLCPNKNMDFLVAYTPIVSVEQRVRYKSEFNQYYAKYRTLHKVLDQVSKKFADLEARLKKAQKGSQDFKNVKHRIVEEYEKNKKNQTYQEARSNFQYLHEKLAHIKKLVHDYDTNNLSMAGPTNR